MKHYSVVLGSCPETLTYMSDLEIRAGSTVRVPFRKRELIGLVSKKTDSSGNFVSKEIISVIGASLLESWQMQLIDEISEYYCCYPAQAARLVLPSFVWNEKQPERAVFLELTDQKPDIPESAKKQRELVEALRERTLELSDTRNNFSDSVIRSLLNKKIVRKKFGNIVPGFHIQSCDSIVEDKNLSAEQQHVFDTITRSEHKKFLIHGVTGSGKTEVYLRLVKQVVLKQQGAIILVPEIALTTQLIQYFSAHFDNKIAVLHSNMTDHERAQEWWRLKTGEVKIVLGSRSALFAPVQNLALIVIDEEHEWTYKQDKAPRYHARTVAETICKLLPDVTLVLGSATPDIETYYRSMEKKDFMLLEMNDRYGFLQHSITLPDVSIVDLREEFLKKNYSIFSELLKQKLSEVFENNEQAILFLNKRGSASSITCRECGYACKCDHCDISMTLHEKRANRSAALICHHCGAVSKPPVLCPCCKSVNIKSIGIGTQRVEKELQKLFPNIRILRADRDTTITKHAFENIYNDFKSHKADVLVGTQMIAKGLDIPKVNLVGIILADVGLHIPDFRSGEKAFQLLTQVAGRSGRREKQGEVVIQTYCPTHPSVVFAGNHDYKRFYLSEIVQRKDFGYPPFGDIIKLTYVHKDKKICFETAGTLFVALQEKVRLLNFDIDVSYAPAAIPKLHGTYRWHIYLQGEKSKELLLHMKQLNGWRIDRDPMIMG